MIVASAPFAESSALDRAYPIVTGAEAQADRASRARRHVSDCVLLALVTTPDISADLIDRAIDHARDCAVEATALQAV